MSASQPRTVILLSSRTSATGSIWRACQALGRGRWRLAKPVDEAWRERRMDSLREWVPPEEGVLAIFNAPERFNAGLDHSRYRFILNARDPRDLACNQFHWKLVHPAPNDGPGDLEKRAAAALREGIDAAVLKMNNKATYEGLRHVAANAPRENWMFLGYAMWCLHPDEAIRRLADFMGVDIASLPPAQREALMQERTPDIASNPKWIGQRWAGADTAPGRHRTELRPETIARLNATYAGELQWLSEVDDPRLAGLYAP